MTLIELARKMRPLIVKAAQSLEDADAVQAVELYDEWKPDTQYAMAYKVRRNGKVYRAMQAHTSQDDWMPENTPALWEVIDETHAGTLEDPIPYEGNMTLTNGLYYTQDGEVYKCIRDTIYPVHNRLEELIALYVEKVSK